MRRETINLASKTPIDHLDNFFFDSTKEKEDINVIIEKLKEFWDRKTELPENWKEELEKYNSILFTFTEKVNQIKPFKKSEDEFWDKVNLKKWGKKINRNFSYRYLNSKHNEKQKLP
jgi:phage gp29-like protein